MSDDVKSPLNSRLFVLREPLLDADGKPTGQYHYVLCERLTDLHQGRVEPGMASQTASIARALDQLFANGPIHEAVAVTKVFENGAPTMFSKIVNGNASQ
ncbi:hypothetical protein [Sphingomonas sp. MMS24-J13]|uniref:hypothetical protein n=1 Tax=Sphingomonas sp. MMS24-J13 TaxID=3238686 RepID=UPI00384C9588